MSSASVTTNFTNGLVIDADQVDQNFQDLVAFCNNHLVHNHDAAVLRHGVRLHKGVSAVGSASTSAITWGDERQDTDGYWSAGTTVTIPAGMAGIYAISFSVAAAVTGRSFVQISPTIVSGLLDVPSEWRIPMDATEDRGLISVTTPLGVGDSFVCEVFHSTGGAVNFESLLSCYRISP